MVGTRGEHFYLRSLRLGKEVIVRQSHMLNLMLAPNVCRFLLEVSLEQQIPVRLFDWGIVSNTPYLPRVVYKKIVVSPAQWNLREDMVHADEEARFLEELRQWRTKWQVPRYVYLTEFDNRLLLNLEHPLSQTELRDELSKAKNKCVVLQEMLPGFEQLWLRDAKDEGYFAEFVVPVIARKQTPTEQRQHQPVSSQQRPVPDHERRFLPGSEWTYLKIYATFKQHDEIITHAVREIVNRLTEEGLIDCWFFIRYADPEPHLRIRFHASTERCRSAVVEAALA